MVFSKIEAEGNSFLQNLWATFKSGFSGISAFIKTQDFSFSEVFSASLEKDTSALQAYAQALNNNVPSTEAFAQNMSSASKEAQEFAENNIVSAESIATFATQQKESSVAIAAQNKSLSNCKTLIAEYNSGCKTSGLTQGQFVSAVGKSNKSLSTYLSGLKGAKGSLVGYIASLVASKAATIALEAASMALNMTLTMGVSWALSKVISLVKEVSEREEEARESMIESASSAKEESENIRELYSAYLEASAAYQNGTGTKDSYTSATEALCEALGIEDTTVLKLIDDYGGLNEAINQAAIKELQENSIEIDSGIAAAKENLYKAAHEGINTTTDIYFDEDDSSEILKTLSKYDEDLDIYTDYMGSLGLKGGITNSDDIITLYEDILHYENIAKEAISEGNLTNDEWVNSSFYQELQKTKSELQEEYETYAELVEAAQENATQLGVYEYFEDNGIPETAEEYNELRESVIKAAESSGYFGDSQEDIESAVDDMLTSLPELTSAFAETGYATTYVSETYQKAAEAITETVEEATESVTNLLSTVSAAQEAVGSQQTGFSISVEDFNSEELEDYQSALEYVNGTMQLNADKVREISEAKVEEQVATNNTNKALEQTKYLENAKQIQKYREQLRDASFTNAEARQQIEASIDSLLEENATIAETCTQYDLLSATLEESISAYQGWLDAQSGSDYGEMADDIVSAMQLIQDTFDSESDSYGQIGSQKFEAAVEFAVPDSVDKDNAEAIEAWKDDFSQYLNFDDDGGIDSLNINQFLNNAVEAGLMEYDDEDGFVIAGQKSMEDFAEGLNMSSGMVQAFFDELQLYGGEFDWSDEVTKTFGDMAVEANEAAEALRQIDGNSNLKILLDVSEFEDAEKACETLDSTIEEMNEIKGKANVDSSEVEYANTVIEYCVAQKQILNEPAVMTVDVSQVSGEIGEALDLLQQFQTAQNTVEVQAAIGADTSSAESEVAALTSEIQALSPEIQTKLDIDTTSAKTIQSSIDGLSADAIVKCGVDSSLVSAYISSDLDKEATVTYTKESSAVDEYSPDNYQRAVTYTCVHGDVDMFLSTLENVTRTVTYNVVTNGSVNVNGTANANGTANVSGTAKAGGNWGSDVGGKTLVGELGREILVNPSTGRWYTVGDNGAEFVDVPRGAIVFNHRQTESLLENGYVAGRAHALVGGTAMVTGGIKTDFLPDVVDAIVDGITTATETATSNIDNYSSNDTTSYDNSSSSDSSSSDTTDDSEPQAFDWIEILLDRIKRNIDSLARKAESTFKELATRVEATNSEISAVNNEISVQQQAAERYMQEAKNVALPVEIMDKIQSGTIDISEYDDETQELIQDYQEWYEKSLDCSEAIEELHETLAQLYIDNFENIQSDFENQLDLLEYSTKTYETKIDILEAKGYLESTKYYAKLQNIEGKNLEILKQELASLESSLSAAMNSGEIEKYSEAWYDMQESINSVKEEIDETNLSLQEYAKTIRETEWGYFDYLEERISQITDESDFLIELLSNQDLYDDNGKFTDAGTATMGLRAQNYNVYMAQADDYAEQIAEIDEEIETDPYNTDLIERREELLGLQQDSIKAAEEEKQAIVDLVEEGIETELDALQDLIDSYTDSLDTAQDLYEYNKKVKEQAEEVSSLQKQLSAYSGDDSEETRATIQKLQADLSDAEETLEETQYDRSISEQKKMLDDLYDKYELILNQRLDNVDALVSDMIDVVNQNSSNINDTLTTATSEVGYTMTENMQNIWGESGTFTRVVSTYGSNFVNQFTTVNNVLNNIYAYVRSMVNNSGQASATNVNVSTSTPTEDTSASSTPANTNTNNDTSGTSNDSSSTYSNFNDDVKRGIAAAIWVKGGSKSGWGNNPTRKQRLTEKFGSENAKAVQDYINAHANNGDLYNYWVSTGKSSLSQYYYSAFKSGGIADYTGMAWLDGTPTKPELVLNAQDTENFIQLKDVLSKLSQEELTYGGINYSGIETVSLSGIKDISDIASSLSLDGGGNSSSIGEVNITIPIDHVEDYEDFVNKLRDDKKFEQFIQSISVDRLSGGSSLAKNKYKW